MTVNKCIVPNDQRRDQLAFLEDIFFKLLKFIIGQRGNLRLELRVGFQLEQFFLGFLVLLVELRLFGCQLRILSFQLFRAGQLGDVVCLEIGCCRLVRCQLCTVPLLKSCGAIFFVFL